MPLKILINGANGRMGRAIVDAVRPEAHLIVAGLDSGDEAGAAIDACEVIIDFSAPAATVSLARLAAARGKPMVIGTTGHSEEEKAAVSEAAWRVPTVWAGNFSIGVNLLFYLTQRAAAVLTDDYNPEVVEMHHRMKKDAPSGTAERLLEILLKARQLPRERVRHGRQGVTGERPAGEIGMHALRGGDVIGDHTVLFAGPGERLELSHKASSRAIFAEGALRAAEWVVEQRAGIYDMQDVLGLKA
jgi:4-hydroxy-tetrahydrodipicolinate reductase